MAVVAMPETAVNKNDCSVFWQDNIRLSRQPRIMQSEPIPEFVKCRPHRKFGFRVLAAYARHHSGACVPVNDVHTSGSGCDC